MRLIAMFVIASSLLAQTGSDLEVTGAVADQFVKSHGQSLVGRNIHWHVPAKALSVPMRQAAGLDLFVSHGIGILADGTSNGVQEVRRRGGAACIRGRVVKTPQNDRKPGEPAYYIAVSNVAHRKH